MHPNTQRLHELIDRFQLQSEDVAEMTGRSKSTVDTWRMNDSPRPIPSAALGTVAMLAPSWRLVRRRAVEEGADEVELPMGSFRWTANVPTDVAAPARGQVATSGWDFDADALIVFEAWSRPLSHGAKGVSDASDGPKALYSSRARALKALRHEVAKQSVNRLAVVDDMIDRKK